MRTQPRSVPTPGRLTPLRLAAFSVAAAVVIVLVLYHVSGQLFRLGRFEIYMIVAWTCIVAAGAGTVALAVWLAVTHRRGWLIPNDLVSGLCERLEEGDYEEAQAIAVARPRGVAPVLFEALDRLRRGRGGIVESAIGQCDYEKRVLEGRVAWLGVLARLTYLFGVLASLMATMEVLWWPGLLGCRSTCPCRPGTLVLPLAVSLGVALPALAAHLFFTRRTEKLAAEIGAVAAEVLDYVLCDPRAAAYSQACERARAEPVFRRVRSDQYRGEAEAPCAALGGTALRRRATSLGVLALSACAASVMVLEILAALSLVSARDFMRGALAASFWVVGGLGVIGVGLVVVTGITMSRRGPDVPGASSHERPARIERMAGWLRVIGRTALLAGVLAMVLAMMKEAEAMRTIWFWFDIEGLLAKSFAPLALALSVFVFADVAGRLLRKRARKLCAEVRPAGVR